MDFIKKYKYYLAPLLVALIFFLSSLGFYGYKMMGKNDQASSVEDLGPVVALPTIPPAERVFNVLLLGHGDASHPGGDLADALVILQVDTDKNRAALISIPRDTWVTLPVNGQNEGHKINEAYFIGKKTGDEKDGFELMKKAVTKVTNLPIHYYVFVDFRGLKQAVDILGGVTVDVPQTFNDPFYPIRGMEVDTCGMSPQKLKEINETLSGFELEKQYECRYENLKFTKGETKMNGETALKFVRSRHSGTHGGDFARAERQQTLLLGVKDKLISLDALNNAPKLFNQLIYAVRTDIDQKVVKMVVDLVADPNGYTISKLVLSNDNAFDSSKNSRGQFILVPKQGADQWQSIHQLILELLNKS